MPTPPLTQDQEMSLLYQALHRAHRRLKAKQINRRQFEAITDHVMAEGEKFAPRDYEGR
jgi:hypothetical protein